jgi:hypothetical protein
VREIKDDERTTPEYGEIFFHSDMGCRVREMMFDSCQFLEWIIRVFPPIKREHNSTDQQ